jgi:hypothetical protein
MSENADGILRGWHIDKKLSVGHLLTTLVVAVGAVFWLTNLDKRTEINTVSITTLEGRQDRMETRQIKAHDGLKEEISAGFIKLHTQFQHLNDRLDKRVDGK